ncbi:TPA: hypothetical protein DDW69_04555 [candidate division CPR2 bacterium]|uniref:Type IV pilus modification protein PilV n=1 Tax=candidate division CPR2 bacterium GW2011_GWC1_41_48 TaxID=1618344 RepID=A0A0G0W8K8_UNCC2|nr:MAG: hypothetical protein UT47_C0002G0211 [candidate division CPR2 bacterium GW2011_GWC2_39_35]KKR29069.1 MAG: hypothetical protein UT60_C0007G0014 [candidate division CPR2 bacterium GW2011_GWD2_39_7]KKS09315.1 MAG: hypothetical protein UU65_C0002G0093 [candidate division CPR2 bacterium GW2011_GWC1_41_48]OGB70557.1 MAG: hypothetical protein A2Y26_04420 [candidate division CPR2 bacterium GWD2_39_7]HBG82071.1 hypothetical protein [candidate division CPR2 bacterium]
MRIGKRGETILEVVVAMGILGLIMAGTISIIIQMGNLGYVAKSREEATKLAQQTMENIYTYKEKNKCDFYNIAGSKDINSDGELVNYSIDDGYKRLDATDFRGIEEVWRKIVIERLDYDPQKLLVTVKVRWQSKGMPEQFYSVQAIMADWQSL